MEISVLLVGFMIGLRHALEADHVAAVASIVTQKQGQSAAWRHGAVWGLGHTITLFAFGTLALLADTLMPHCHIFAWRHELAATYSLET